MGQTSLFHGCSPASDSHLSQEVIAEHHLRATDRTPPRACWAQGGKGWAHKASSEGQCGAAFTLGNACPSSPALCYGVVGDWFPVLAMLFSQGQCFPIHWPHPALVQRRAYEVEALVAG